MPMKSDPTAATAKWLQNLSQSQAAITRGVQAVTVAPGQLAAAQSDKWLQRVQNSQAKWKANVSRVDLGSWQQSMINIGIPRVSSGAQAKQGKYTAFASDFFPFLANGVAQVKAMPSTTLQDNINRAVAMIQHNATFKRSR